MANIFTQRVADTFIRPIASTLGPQWTAAQGSGLSAIQITNPATGNAVPTVDGNVCLEYFVGAGGFQPDQWAECKIVARANNSCLVGVVLRGLYGAWVDGYFGGAFNTGANYTIYRVKKGIFTLLATSGSAVTVGDVIRLSAQGSLDANGNPSVALTLFRNGVSDTTFTDTSVTGGLILSGQPGLILQSSGGVANALATNFNAGIVTSAPTINNLQQTNSPIPFLQLGISSNLGTITGIGQALQFFVPQYSERFLGRLQLVVTGGVVSSPVWLLTCNQDQTQNTWFAVPPATLPSSSPMLGEIPTLYNSWYEISGLGGTFFHFGLVSGSLIGTLTVNALTG